jgi:hypothetical protein
MIKFSPDGRWLAAVIDREIWVWDAYTGEKVTIFPGHENGVQTLTFSPNSKTIASGGSDGTVLIWDLSSHVHEPSARPPVTAQKSWADLKNSDAKVAYQAMHMLTINPEATCKLAQGLRADPGMPPEELTQCIRDLDNSQFSARDKATKRLEEAREQALPALRKLLEQQPSLELERRAKKIIDSISSNQLPAEASLHLRAIEVLERVGSSSARSVLEKIAEGNPLSQRTVEAKAALDRLNTSERK